MEYAAFVFGIFGLLAYLKISALEKKIDDLEQQLTKVEGTTYAADRSALIRTLRTCIGKKVDLDLKEDYMDADVMMCGNTAHGSNTILDMDEDWMLVRIESKKGIKEKLIRLNAVERITMRETE